MIYRRIVARTALFAAAIAVLLIGAHSARAALLAADPTPGDPGQQVVALLDLIMTGKYIPAVGVFLVALVAAMRAGLGAWVPWFKSKAGGFVLGFGSAALLYVGTAMQAGQMSLGVVFAALGAGWAAAGGWEHLRDIVTWLRPPTQEIPAVSRGSVVSVVLGCASTVALVGAFACLVQACTGAKAAGTVIVDCTGGNATGIVSNILATLDGWNKPEPDGCRTASGWNWKCIESGALSKGEQIGGCALAEFVQSFLTGTKAASTDESWIARAALENARGHWGGAVTWHVADGKDL